MFRLPEVPSQNGLLYAYKFLFVARSVMYQEVVKKELTALFPKLNVGLTDVSLEDILVTKSRTLKYDNTRLELSQLDSAHVSVYFHKFSHHTKEYEVEARAY